MQRYIFDNIRVPEHLHHLILPSNVNRHLYRYHIKNNFGIKQIFVKKNKVYSFLNAELPHENYIDVNVFEKESDYEVPSFLHFMEYVRLKYPKVKYVIENDTVHPVI